MDKACNDYNTILELKNITKKYPGVLALNNVSLEFKKGEVHALVGENGAGKSTIIKVLTGAIKPDEGTILYEGGEYSHMTPGSALKLGISAIYQEFNLIQYLTVAENIFLGQEDLDGTFLDFKKNVIDAQKLLDEIGVNIDAKSRVRELGTAYQQIIEIVKSVSRDCKVLIMDEPTAPLTNNEVVAMNKMIVRLKEKGVTIIYVSHRLEEIFNICDRISVLRDGQYICTKDTKDTDRQDLISLMVGRELKEQFPQSEASIHEVCIEVKNLNTKFLKDISFEVKKGEILGFGGLVGAGRTEVARAIFGADDVISGEIIINGKAAKIQSPKDAINNGIGLLPEDRKLQGVLLSLPIRVNITFSSIKKIIKFLFIDKEKEKDIVNKYVSDLQIKTPSADQLVKNLSGGNQQKVVLAKCMETDCELLIFDEPTRGIDIKAKQEIYQIMRELAKKGKAIIMISSEMPELIGMSDNIIIMAEGRIVSKIKKEEATQERILSFASLEG